MLAARTLLSHSDQYAAVAFMNVSGVDQTLRRGHALGVVTACPDGTVHPFVQVGFTSPTDYSCNDVHSAGPENDAAELSNVCFDNCSVDVSDETEIKCASVHGVITPEPPMVTSGNDDDCSHIQPVIDKLPSTLTAEQRKQAIALIRRNADVFSRHEFDVGCTNLLTARIITDESHPPISEPLRRHARAHLEL